MMPFYKAGKLNVYVEKYGAKCCCSGALVLLASSRHRPYTPVSKPKCAHLHAPTQARMQVRADSEFLVTCGYVVLQRDSSRGSKPLSLNDSLVLEPRTAFRIRSRPDSLQPGIKLAISWCKGENFFLRRENKMLLVRTRAEPKLYKSPRGSCGLQAPPLSITPTSLACTRVIIPESSQLNVLFSVLDINVTETHICLSVEVYTIRLPPPEVTLRFLVHFNIMKMGQIVSVLHTTPPECPFHSFDDFQMHWDKLVRARDKRDSAF
ncbi:putative protein C18orf63 [Galemys pyrenaicus]|uniref:DUF4708 domain-containing protein n=1 Tax=Galemys pyrenaicus TaxID=202257 RepID=A0A8J6DAU7_GALPY|nr:putative protein C18orf63 [Galemys pyrenaicus]